MRSAVSLIVGSLILVAGLVVAAPFVISTLGLGSPGLTTTSDYVATPGGQVNHVPVGAVSTGDGSTTQVTKALS